MQTPPSWPWSCFSLPPAPVQGRQPPGPWCAQVGPHPRPPTSLQGCISRNMLTWPAAGKLDELTSSGRSDAASRLPPPASLPVAALTTPQMLVRIRGLATACPTVYRHWEKESQRGALAYRKPHWLLLRVRGGQWGPCTSNSIHTVVLAMLFWRGRSGQGGRVWSQNHLRTSLSQMVSLVAQAICTAPPWPLPSSQAPMYP